MLLKLTKAYSEPHRAYHVLSHPVGMIELGNKIFEGKLTDEQILAIWYHDYVYVAGSKTNELESSGKFFEHYGHSTTIALDLVQRIILDTKEHIPTVHESRAVIDLDLIGLSDNPRNYRINAVNVRAEYSAFSDEEWKVGRIKFLKKMIGREQIYYTDLIKSFEPQARFNMEYELNLLRIGNPKYK